MGQIPDWWLWLSGLFFAVNALVLIAVAILLFKVVAMLGALKPKVENLVDKVNEVAVTVDQVAKDTKLTVETVGAHTRSLVANVDQIGSVITGQILKAVPFLNGLVTFSKLVQMARNLRPPKAKAPKRSSKKVLDS